MIPARRGLPPFRWGGWAGTSVPSVGPADDFPPTPRGPEPHASRPAPDLPFGGAGDALRLHLAGPGTGGLDAGGLVVSARSVTRLRLAALSEEDTSAALGYAAAAAALACARAGADPPNEDEVEATLSIRARDSTLDS